jgi:HEAT repeat protein
LMNLLKSDADTRWETIPGLAKLKDRRAVERMIPFLKDTNPEIRLTAARALGELGDESSVDALIEALRKKDNDRVRWSMGEALRKITHKKFLNEATEWEKWLEYSQRKADEMKGGGR